MDKRVSDWLLKLDSLSDKPSNFVGDIWVTSEEYFTERKRFIIYCVKRKITFQVIADWLGITKARVYEVYRYSQKNGIGRTISIRKDIKKREGYRCAFCREKRNLLHIHHIGNPRNHTAPNLVALCPKCHCRLERFNKYIKKIKNL